MPRRQAQAFHVLRSASNAVATKHTEEFLCAVSCEDDPDNDPYGGQAETGAGKQYLVDQCAHAVSSIVRVCSLAAILIDKTNVKSALIAT
ncbi:hypothetical protein D3C80_1905340 [compost metagenome]